MIQSPFPRKFTHHSSKISAWIKGAKIASANALDLLWHFISRFWKNIFVGMIFAGIIGNAAYAYITHGKFDPIYFPHLSAILWIETHTVPAFLLFFCLLSLSIGALAVHRNKQKSKALAPLKSFHTLQRVKFLDPHNFKLVHYVQRAYIERDADEQARQILHDLATKQNTRDKTTLGICIVGRAAQGKTRLAWEAMQAELADWTLVRWVHEQTNLSDIMAYQTKKIILWLDDLHEYANLNESVVLNDLPRRFLEKENQLIIIATCRDGDNYTQTKKYFESLLERLVTIILPNIDEKEAIELAKILVKEGKEDDVHSKEFDGTPGSLILGLGRMHRKYLGLPKPAQTLLKTMKLLYSAQIYTYPEKRLTAVAHDLFSFQPSFWQESAEILEQEGFTTTSMSSEGERLFEQVADSYLEEKVIQDYPTTQMSLADDWPRIKNSFERTHDASGLVSLGNAFNEQAKKSSKVQHEHAVQCYRAALKIYTREQAPLDWAGTQNNLGAALSNLADRLEGNESLQQLQAAISAYRAALQVYTREQAPLDWAMTQNNLGTALSNLAARLEGGKNLQQFQAAISAFRAALLVQTREQAPLDWAMTQNNLGATLSNLADRLEGNESLQQLQTAISAYRAALQVYTREQALFQWATTQNNLGNALRNLAVKLEGEESLQQFQAAISAFRAALLVQTREQTPFQWAMTQNNLGATLRNLADRLEGEESLQQLQAAISAFREALHVRTREQAPLDWAVTQNNLGNALSDLAASLEGDENLQQLHAAISAFQAALQVHIREQAPLDWAMTQNNLGIALSDLAARLEGDESLQQLQAAISAFQATLQVYTCEQAPFQWATTQNNLGNALCDLAAKLEGEESIQQLQAAISAFRATLQVCTREQAPFQWAFIHIQIAKAHFSMADKIEEKEICPQLQTASHCVEQALSIFSVTCHPDTFTQLQNFSQEILQAMQNHQCHTGSDTENNNRNPSE